VRELETRRGKDSANLSEIVERYEQAYTLAIANGFTQDAALAKELSWQVRRHLSHSWYFGVVLTCACVIGANGDGEPSLAGVVALLR